MCVSQDVTGFSRSRVAELMSKTIREHPTAKFFIRLTRACHRAELQVQCTHGPAMMAQPFGSLERSNVADAVLQFIEQFDVPTYTLCLLFNPYMRIVTIQVSILIDEKKQKMVPSRRRGGSPYSVQIDMSPSVDSEISSSIQINKVMQCFREYLDG